MEEILILKKKERETIWLFHHFWSDQIGPSLGDIIALDGLMEITCSNISVRLSIFLWRGTEIRFEFLELLSPLLLRFCSRRAFLPEAARPETAATVLIEASSPVTNWYHLTGSKELISK